jgi:hypothetical protein
MAVKRLGKTLDALDEDNEPGAEHGLVVGFEQRPQPLEPTVQIARIERLASGIARLARRCRQREQRKSGRYEHGFTHESFPRCPPAGAS